MQADALAKVNLGLLVGRRRPDGFHPLRSVFQSVSLADRLELESAVEDSVESWAGGEVIDGDRNLAWRAVEAVRGHAGSPERFRLRLRKHIPAAAGLGGGSADAAAALRLAGGHLAVGHALLEEIAPTLGSDVPFCLSGGTALVQGRGDEVAPLDPILGYALALVVPPAELATPQVFAAWDDLGEPTGPVIPASAVPPQLRHVDLRNDLYPAAVAVAPAVDDWRQELAGAWGRPVTMSGSGPSLYAFFVDEDEAAAALAAVPRGARLAEAVTPQPVGWRALPDPDE